MKTYTTKGGEMLDEICFAHYGNNSQSTQVLKANPALVNAGFILPPGLKINLPNNKPVTDEVVTLW